MPLGSTKSSTTTFDVAGYRIDAVNVVLFLLGLLLDALIVTADAVDRICEPDRAVGGDGDVIGRVQFLAVVLIRDDGDRAVELGLCDAPGTMLWLPGENQSWVSHAWNYPAYHSDLYPDRCPAEMAV